MSLNFFQPVGLLHEPIHQVGLLLQLYLLLLHPVGLLIDLEHLLLHPVGLELLLFLHLEGLQLQDSFESTYHVKKKSQNP